MNHTKNCHSGEVYARVPDSTPEHVEQAVQAAERAMSVWGGYSPKQRSDIMLKIASLLEGRLEEFAIAESSEQV